LAMSYDMRGRYRFIRTIKQQSIRPVNVQEKLGH
jgi:hypothetical protein